jgi:hypothetical protein
LGPVNISDIFILDDPAIVGDLNQVDATYEANGVLPVIPNATGTFGELPWGWGEF